MLGASRRASQLPRCPTQHAHRPCPSDYRAAFMSLGVWQVPPASLVPPRWPAALLEDLLDGLEGSGSLSLSDRSRVLGALAKRLEAGAGSGAGGGGSRRSRSSSDSGRGRSSRPGAAVPAASSQPACSAVVPSAPLAEGTSRKRARSAADTERQWQGRGPGRAPKRLAGAPRPLPPSAEPAHEVATAAAAGTEAPPSGVPAQLWEALYPFQRDGVAFGLSRRGRVLIGDEMGLGKTLQGLTLACAYRAQWREPRVGRLCCRINIYFHHRSVYIYAVGRTACQLGDIY
eukprot:COSAG01_NODE_3271_length_6320_cov_8.998554_1_plen_287_part_00